MRKKLPFIILSVIIFLQLCVPAGLIIDRNLAESKGEKFKFYVEEMRYNNGNVIFLIPVRNTTSEKIYAEFEINKNGFAELYTTEKRPKSKYYIRSQYNDSFMFPVTDTTVTDFSHLFAHEFKKNYDKEYTPNGIDGLFNEAYIEASVYKGRVGEPVLYIDGLEAEEYFSAFNEKIKNQ